MMYARKCKEMDRNVAGMKSREEQPFKAGKVLHKFNKERNTSPKRKQRKKKGKHQIIDNENVTINLLWAICPPKHKVYLWDMSAHLTLYDMSWCFMCAGRVKEFIFFVKKNLPKQLANCWIPVHFTCRVGVTHAKGRKKTQAFFFFFQEGKTRCSRHTKAKKNTRK